MRNASLSFLQYTVFLLTWLLYLALGGLASCGPRFLALLPALSPLSCSSTSGTDSSAAYSCCVELLSRSLSLSLKSCCRLEICNIVPGDCAVVNARGLHHCIRRLSCGLLEVGLRYVLDLAASHRLGHLCLPLHLWSHCSFLRDLDLFLKLFDITSIRSFQGVRISPGTFLL